MARFYGGTYLLFTGLAIAALVSVLAAKATEQPVAAQQGEAGPASAAANSALLAQGEYWTSSEDPPPGTPLELLSPPDTAAPSGAASVDSIAGVELVSWRALGSALSPRTTGASYAVGTSGGCVYASGGSAFSVLNAIPNLPNGAVVNTVRMYYRDTSDSNSNGWFTVYDLYGVIAQEWSVSSTGSTGNSFNDSVPISHTINYSTYSYALNWRPVVVGTTMQLCGFRVFYEPPPFGVSYLPFLQHGEP